MDQDPFLKKEEEYLLSLRYDPPPRRFVVPQKYPFPVDFNPGVGVVRELNEELQQNYGSIGWVVNDWWNAYTELQWYRCQEKKIRCSGFDCYAKAAIDRSKKKLRVLVDSVIAVAGNIKQDGGDPFPIPYELNVILRDMIRLPPAFADLVGPFDETSESEEEDISLPAPEAVQSVDPPAEHTSEDIADLEAVNDDSAVPAPEAVKSADVSSDEKKTEEFTDVFVGLFDESSDSDDISDVDDLAVPMPETVEFADPPAEKREDISDVNDLAVPMPEPVEFADPPAEKREDESVRFTEEVKKRIADLLKQYIKNGDTAEACRCIRELAVPFFHHEVVKRALTLGMESPAAEALIAKLLKEASKECLIISSQMMKGFSCVAESLDDLILDIPSAKSEFQLLVSKAISQGWLNSSYVHSGADNSVEDDEHEKLASYKREAVSIIHEYFLSDDTTEVIRSLKELGYPEYNPIFVKKLITIALDRKNREKEMASVLLSSLSMELFSTEDIAKGARAVIDDVLALLNLDEISSKLPPDCSGAETLNMARSLASARHAGERLLRCWGGRSGWAVEDAKDKITKLLEEYESGGDVGEACNCIRKLDMPFFNHEVVKTALVMAMEKKNERTLSLLQECFGEGIITINQMTEGFSGVKDGLEDLALDIPDAKEKFVSYMELAKKRGWVLPSSPVEGALEEERSEAETEGRDRV